MCWLRCSQATYLLLVCRYTGCEEVIVVTRDRCADLVPPGAFTLVLGPGGRQFGTYGVGPDCMWFASRQ